MMELLVGVREVASRSCSIASEMPKPPVTEHSVDELTDAHLLLKTSVLGPSLGGRFPRRCGYLVLS